MTRIEVPSLPRFMPCVDEKSGQLYITCFRPFALIWVKSGNPPVFYILRGKQNTELLHDAADWFSAYLAAKSDKN